MPRDSVSIGKKAGVTNKKRHGKDFYRKIGAMGGRSRKKPYYHFKHLKETDPEALKELGRRTAKGYAGKVKEIRE